MANTPVATQDAALGGLAPVYTAPNAVDTFQIPNDGRTLLHVKKSGAGACTVTLQTPGTVRGQAIADPTVVVPATTGDRMIGPFPVDLFSDTLNVTYSEATGLTHAAIHLPAV